MANGAHMGGQPVMNASQLAPQLMGLVGNPAIAAQAHLFQTPGATMMPNGTGFLMTGANGQAMMVSNLAMNNTMMAANNMDTNQSGTNGTHIAPNMNSMNAMMGPAGTMPLPPMGPKSSTNQNDDSKKGDLSAEERAQQNRDRNREHARSTRLRKKAYVQKLKELVEGLHAERTEEVRQRRVAIQHLAEMQNVRRSVVRNFLSFLSSYETDERKWATILENDFWLKQPVTPYRSFRRSEIEKVRCSFALLQVCFVVTSY